MSVRIVLALAAVAFAAHASADEPKKDEKTSEPSAFYTSWSKFKPGTMVTMKVVTGDKAKPDEFHGTLKLTEGDQKGGKLVLESEFTRTVDGKEEKVRSTKGELGESDNGPGMPPLDPKTHKPAVKYDNEGTEKLKIGGTEYECKWYQKKEKLPSGLVADVKVWLCDQVPGLLVRSTQTVGEKVENITITAVTVVK